jgi:hypothetical protein
MNPQLMNSSCTKIKIAMLCVVLASIWGCSSQDTPAPSSSNLLMAKPVAAQAPAAQTAPTGATRTEHDLLGDLQVPADAYYGVQTARALQNFQISGIQSIAIPNLSRRGPL